MTIEPVAARGQLFLSVAATERREMVVPSPSAQESYLESGRPERPHRPERVAPPNAASAKEEDPDTSLPPEVSLAEAARIANCDKKTVLRYLNDGLLEWRNIAPPSSSRPTYRVRLSSIIALRTTYRYGPPAPTKTRTSSTSARTAAPPNRPLPSRPLKHVRLS